LHKNFVLSILLVFVFSCSVFSQQKYSYIEYELPNNVVREGTLLFNEKDQILEIDVNVIGKIHSSVYKTQAKKIEGFNIWDIKSPNGRFEISIFTFNIGSNKKFTDDFKTSKVETIDRTHPYFKDQMWRFYVSFKGYESINIDNRNFETIRLYTQGERPTGPGHCMYGGYGVINIDSWYEKKSGKLVKQIFTKRNCRPYDYKFLSKEIIQLTSDFDENSIEVLISDKSLEIKLKKLKKLRDENLIDDDVFTNYQKKILDEKL